MAESTLTLVLSSIKSELGAYLGISRTVGDWTAENAADIARILASGQRQFYDAYAWSFLVARASITTANGTATYTLADDFDGFLDKELAFTSTKDWSLKLVEPWRVLEKIQAGTSMPSGISQPLLAFVESLTSTLGTTGQRYQIVMWPTPTSTLVVTGRYRLRPNALGTDTHYPLGGEIHAQTMLESCLAAAEEFQNDQSTLHRERFAELLAKSIQNDQRLHIQEAA